MAALEHISLIFIEQRDAHTNEYSLITFSVVTISLLVFNVFSSLTSQNVHLNLILHHEMLDVEDEG